MVYCDADVNYHHRADPDALLGLVQEEEAQSRRGRLKIFFGGCAGTGKTYAMLSAAQEQLREGVEVIAGIVETHGRTETQKLLAGIPLIPMIEVMHKGIALKEFNLDAAKSRKPVILLVDELAHTNAPGSRHSKRWQDVEELLAAGINIYTTLNVQHLESLNDTVTAITGIRVAETVPDSVFDTAGDITLVDIPADELLKRLREGKVYLGEQARGLAAEHFFKKNIVIALRELALRRTTERVDAQMEAYNLREGTRGQTSSADKVMVCIGPGALSAKLVRTAKRMAASLKCPWTAVYVENIRHYRLSETVKASVEATLRMAERLGGSVSVLQGDNATEEIIAHAQNSGVTKIILGKTARSRWRDMLFGSLLDKLVRRSGAFDVYVVAGDFISENPLPKERNLPSLQWRLYGVSLAAVAVFTLFGISVSALLHPADQALLYLVGNVVVAARLGRGPSLLYALLSATCLNFFFLPPLYTFEIYDRSYLMTLCVMVMTSLVITSYATRLKLQASLSRKRELRTQLLYAMTRELTTTRGYHAMAEVAVQHIGDVFAVDVTVWMPDAGGNLMSLIGELPEADYVKEMAVLQWCYDNRRQAGRGTSTMPSATGLYLPLMTSNGTLGIIGLLPRALKRQFALEEISSLETIASLLSSAMERAKNAELAEAAKVEAESEKLRSILLSTVSHDLRTPLASITGAASSIVMGADSMSKEIIGDLGRSIQQEAGRLSRIITNLLDVTSLESGKVRLNLQPYFIEEVIGSAITHLEKQFGRHKIITEAEPDLPMIMADGLLIEQVLVNLLENAVKYTPDDSTIWVRAALQNHVVAVSVADNGSGIPSGYEKKIFDKFYTTALHKAQKGTGLGLSICQGVVRAHGGEIEAKNRPEGGALFCFTLPIAEPLMEDTRHDDT